VLGAACSSGTTDGVAATSAWEEAHKTKARLVTGRTAETDGGRLLAFVEIALKPGWKTYWRTPGDAGGLPPAFDWSKSTNLSAATVMFPAPKRFTDKSGNTIGYEGGLVLPVSFAPKDAAKPVSLVVGLQYGICKDVCVPIELELTLDVPANEDAAAPAEALEALDAVPRAQDKARPGDPVVASVESILDGKAPKITIAGLFPGGESGAAAFIEAPDNLFLPLPARTGEGPGGSILFEAPLGPDVDVAALRGKTVTVTLVSDTGATFATFVAD
jgi:DsbC/DsbD-like thiol-disulfide interchange protein